MEIKVTLENLTIGDLEVLDRASRNELSPGELVDFLDRVVVGGARALPLSALGDIVQALTTALAGLAVQKGN